MPPPVEFVVVLLTAAAGVKTQLRRGVAVERLMAKRCGASSLFCDVAGGGTDSGNGATGGSLGTCSPCGVAGACNGKGDSIATSSPRGVNTGRVGTGWNLGISRCGAAAAIALPAVGPGVALVESRLHAFPAQANRFVRRRENTPVWPVSGVGVGAGATVGVFAAASAPSSVQPAGGAAHAPSLHASLRLRFRVMPQCRFSPHERLPS